MLQVFVFSLFLLDAFDCSSLTNTPRCEKESLGFIPEKRQTELPMDWPMMHFGKIAFQATSSEHKIRIEKTYSSYKSVQSLLDVADSYTALPNGEMQKVLEDSLKKAGDGISTTFFNKTPANAFFGEHGYTSIRNELAADLASIDLTTVSRVSDFIKGRVY
eukprot:gene612-1274_t